METSIFIFDLNGVLLRFSLIDMVKTFFMYPKKWLLLWHFLSPQIIIRSIKLVQQENIVENAVLKLIEEFPHLACHKDYMLVTINCQVIKKSNESITSLKKRGKKIYALSNIGKHSMQLLKQQYPTFFAQFDEVYYPADNQLCKPNPLFYINKLGHLQADKIYFIDDKKENLTTAHAIGYVPIKFKNARQLKTELEAL